MKRYTPEEMEQMNKKADTAVKTMTATGIGIGFAPVGIDVTAFMALMGTGVIGIAHCYGAQLNKEEAGDLIKHFFKAAGQTLSIVLIGTKMVYSLMKSNPVTYLPFMIADAVVCGTAAYTVASTSKNYFRRRAEGRKATDEEIKKWMEEGKIQGKKLAKKAAEEKAREIRKKAVKKPSSEPAEVKNLQASETSIEQPPMKTLEEYKRNIQKALEENKREIQKLSERKLETEKQEEEANGAD